MTIYTPVPEELNNKVKSLLNELVENKIISTDVSKYQHPSKFYSFEFHYNTETDSVSLVFPKTEHVGIATSLGGFASPFVRKYCIDDYFENENPLYKTVTLEEFKEKRSEKVAYECEKIINLLQNMTTFPEDFIRKSK